MKFLAGELGGLYRLASTRPIPESSMLFVSMMRFYKWMRYTTASIVFTLSSHRHVAVIVKVAALQI